MAYTADNPDYFTYIYELDDDEQAEQAADCNLHDLLVLARLGQIHPDIVALFHNLIQSNRPDSGMYVWDADIVRPMHTRFGAGRIHAVDRATDYTNNGASGPRDFAEMLNMKDAAIQELNHPHARYLRTNLERFPKSNRTQFLFLHYIGNYLLAWTLVEGKRRKRLGRLNWEDMSEMRELMKTLQERYHRAYKAFTGETDNQIYSLVDWMRFAQQMAFFMSGAYKAYITEENGRYISRPLPKALFGRECRIIPGDGWGYVNRNIVESRLAAFLPSDASERSRWINKYFHRPTSTRRRVPTDILAFRLGSNEQIQKIHDGSLRAALEELYNEYGSGWRFDGIHEDLGPVNGPLPLQEMVKANYIYTTFMMRSKAASSPGEAHSELIRQLPKGPVQWLANILTSAWAEGVMHLLVAFGLREGIKRLIQEWRQVMQGTERLNERASRRDAVSQLLGLPFSTALGSLLVISALATGVAGEVSVDNVTLLTIGIFTLVRAAVEGFLAFFSQDHEIRHGLRYFNNLRIEVAA